MHLSSSQLTLLFTMDKQLILTCFYMCRVIYYFTVFREFPQHWFLWNHTSTASFFHIIFPSHFQKWWKFTILRPYDFHRCPIFFWHPTQCMLVFTVLANFLHQILPRKKPSLYEKISCSFLVISGFFLTKCKTPTKKTQILKKKNPDITFATAFFCRIWHKTWISNSIFIEID